MVAKRLPIGCHRRGKEREGKPTPTLYGRFNNVELSDADLNSLETDFPTLYETYIEKLSCYIAEKNKTYKNHYATIVKWITEDSVKQTSTKNKQCGNNVFLQIAQEEGSNL